MKRIITAIALALAAATAHAGVVGFINNEAGSTIKLTDAKCNERGWSSLYATAKGGRTFHGCWFYNSDMAEVVAVYDDGTTYTYPASALNLTNYFYAKYGKDTK